MPVYVNNYEFQDALESEARFAITNRKAPDDIRNDVWKKVVELQIPVDKKDIQIKFPGGGGAGPMAWLILMCRMRSTLSFQATRCN